MQPVPCDSGWASTSRPSLSGQPSQVQALSPSSSRRSQPVVATAGDASHGRTDPQTNYAKEFEPGFILHSVSPILDKLKSSVPPRINMKPSNN